MSEANAFGLGALLDILEREPHLTMHVALWQMRLGASLVSLLRGRGILRECDRVDWYPCLSGLDKKCRCKTLPGRQSPNHPAVSRCGRASDTCRPTPLTESDLYTLTISRDALVRELCHAFGVTGGVMAGDAGFAEVHRIGTLQERPVFLACVPATTGFEFWLVSRGQAFVMVPIGSGLSDVTRAHCAKGRPTELISLEMVLEVNDNGLFAKWPLEPDDEPPSRPSHSVPVLRETPAYLAIEAKGRREITSTEYLALSSSPVGYDLFLDMIGVTKGGGCRASKKTPDGAVIPVILSRAEAVVIVELVLAVHSMRPGEFRSVAAIHVVKILERARHKLDICFGRYEWRAIQTLRANNGGAKAFQFRPPAGMNWLVVTELGAVPNAAMRSR